MEILKSGVIIVFFILDVIAFIITLIVEILKPEFHLEWYFYIAVLFVGYFFASIKVVSDSIKMPEVAFYFKGEGENTKLKIQNTSNLMLRDIKFDDIKINGNHGEETLRFELEGETKFLKPRERRETIFTHFKEGNWKTDGLFLAELKSNRVKDNYKLIVCYANGPSSKCHMVYSMGKDKLKILEPPKLI